MKQWRRLDDRIADAVNLILQRSGPPRLPNGVGIDVAAIVRDYCNLDLVPISPLVIKGRTLLALYVPDLRTVLLEENCNARRQRFSMAHELGHAQLEDDFGEADTLFQAEVLRKAFFCDERDMASKPGDERSKGRRRLLEVSANRFAAQLLMPTDLVKEQWALHRDVQKCCEVLEVSRQTLEIRLEGLHLGSASFGSGSRRLF